MAKQGKAANARTKGESLPFWRRKTLEELTQSEWEQLCDGCGRCCLVKLEDEETRDHYFTAVACRLFDATRCRCCDYAHRSERVPDCVTLTAAEVRKLSWLPPSCAYRLVAEGKDLYWWHPLVSGSRDTVHEAGISVRGKVVAHEDEVREERLVDFIVAWPKKLPNRGRRAATAAPAKPGSAASFGASRAKRQR
jgi:uncharacterized cysteine cluster protein YcgN (CxxCxxCC family)